MNEAHTEKDIYMYILLQHSPLTDSSYHFDNVGRLVTQRQVHTMTSTLVYCNKVDSRDSVSRTIETHTYHKIAMLLIQTTISAYLHSHPSFLSLREVLRGFNCTHTVDGLLLSFR